MPNNIEDLLEERQTTHGEFKDFALISQALSRACQEHPAQFDKLTPVQAEALSMIIVKIGRILNGGSMNKDTWVDIAGYATLVSREL